MTDKMVSQLIAGTTPQYFYGIEGTSPQKYAGYYFYNVKDFGAVGNTFNNDTPSIQNAINAALITGGVVYFPPGTYKVGTVSGIGAITLPGASRKGIRIIGSGLSSLIFTNNRQYIFHVDYGTPGASEVDSPAISFEFLQLQSTAGFAAITDTETCAGCIHISGGGNGGGSGSIVVTPRIHNCAFGITGGIAVYSAAQNMTIDNCFLTGNYTGNNCAQSIGYFLNSGSIRDCKITSIGYPIISVGSGGGAIEISELDIEVSGTVSIGYTPVAFLDTITVGGGGHTDPAGFYPEAVARISTIGFESCGSFDGSDNGNIYLGSCQNVKVENINIYNNDSIALAAQRGPAKWGIYIGAVSNSSLENILIRTGAVGSYVQAGVGIQNPDNVKCVNVTVASNLGPDGTNVLWKWDGTPQWLGGGGTYTQRPITMEQCNFDAELPLANFPLFPSTVNSIMWCSDATSAVPGTVMSTYVQTNASTSTSSTTLHYAANTLRKEVVNGWKVYDVSRQNATYGQTVSGAPGGSIVGNFYNGASLTLSAPPPIVGITSGDMIVFTDPGGGSNKVPLRWWGVNGIGWVVTA